MNKKILISLLLALLPLAGCDNAASHVNKQLESMIAENNKTLPKMLDDDTRLELLEKIPDLVGVNYRYVMVNANTEDINVNNLAALQPIVRSNVCSLKGMDFIIDNEVVMRYSYYSKKGDFVYSFDITPAKDC